MEILSIINKVLGLKAVQWLLLVSTITLSVMFMFSAVRQKALSLQLKAAKGEVASYAAHVAVQNDLIQKAGQEYREAEKRAQNASQEAKKLKKRLKDMGTITISPSDCETMVKQAISEVRK